MRRTRLRPVSKRRATLQARRRRIPQPADPTCRLATDVCTGRAEAWHELVGRAQGGSIIDTANLVAACNRCNGWVEDHPAVSYERGWKVRATASVRGLGGLVPAERSPLTAAAGEESWDG